MTAAAANTGVPEMEIFPFQEEDSDGMHLSACLDGLCVSVDAAKHGAMCRHGSQNSVLTGSQLHIR